MNKELHWMTQDTRQGRKKAPQSNQKDIRRSPKKESKQKGAILRVLPRKLNKEADQLAKEARPPQADPEKVLVEARRRLDELKDKMRVIKWAVEGAGVIVMPCPFSLLQSN